jgi:hypothetical protein
MPQQIGAPPIFSSPFSTTAVPLALTTTALQNTGSATLAGCNTALLTTAAHGYTETMQANGIKSILNAATKHGPPTVGGNSASTFTYFMIKGATGNTAVNNIVVACFRVPSTTTLLVAMPATGANPTGGNLIPVFIPAGGLYNLVLGPNCDVLYNPDNSGLPFQDTKRTDVPVPTWNVLLPASETAQLSFDGAGATIIAADGAAGSSSWSKYFR